MTTPSAPITTPSAPMTTPSTPPSATPPFKDMRTLISEVLLTSNGTSFYIYTKADSETIAHENESSIFMTQTEGTQQSIQSSLTRSINHYCLLVESEDVSILPIVTKCLVIEDEKFSDTKRRFVVCTVHTIIVNRVHVHVQYMYIMLLFKALNFYMYMYT